MASELFWTVSRMNALLPEFHSSGGNTGLILPSQFAAKFKALVIDATHHIDEALGADNPYSVGIAASKLAGYQNLSGGPSYVSVQEVIEICNSALRVIVEKHSRKPAPTVTVKPYVDPSRISALQSMSGGTWDFTRLIALCTELNVAHTNNCHLSTVMLLRTILNHVPPVLGFTSFQQVAASYGGPNTNRSFKEIMHRMEGSLRKIADIHLHSAIRPREDVPTAVQVDFASDLDVLLAEVIRVAGAQP